jgi:hypothetical protein
MTTKQMGVKELSEKVLEGMKIAIKKLVEETAARDGELVIGDKDGNIKHVPAKELLEEVRSENYLPKSNI